MINGGFLKSIPYVNQKERPIVKMIYINNEISLVCFVLKILISWGKKATVVHTVAINPIIIVKFISSMQKTHKNIRNCRHLFVILNYIIISNSPHSLLKCMCK